MLALGLLLVFIAANEAHRGSYTPALVYGLFSLYFFWKHFQEKKKDKQTSDTK